MAARITEVENKILVELNQAPLNSYCKTFKTYDGNMSKDDLDDLKGKLPACLVSYVGDTFPEVTPGSTYMDSMVMSVLVIAKEVRDKGKEKGVHSMLMDVKKILHLSNLGGYLDLPIILKERAPIEAVQRLAVYELVFEIEILD